MSLSSEFVFIVLLIFFALLFSALIVWFSTWIDRRRVIEMKHCPKCGAFLCSTLWQPVEFSERNGTPTRWQRAVWCSMKSVSMLSRPIPTNLIDLIPVDAQNEFAHSHYIAGPTIAQRRSPTSPVHNVVVELPTDATPSRPA